MGGRFCPPLQNFKSCKAMTMCSSRKNPYPPHGRSLEIPRGRGVLKTKFLKAMYENKLEFPRGRGGCKTKKPSMGGVWIFFDVRKMGR